jgi:hypothetical protein
MNNAPAILRSLIVYAVSVPLALIFGYLLTDPMQYSTFAYGGVVMLVLAIPLLLRCHYWLLLLAWNMAAVVFLLPGRPNLWLATTALSLGMSLLQRALSKEMHFIKVPQLTWPLICLVVVVIFTAKLTGGFGLKSFGSEVYGGKKYVYTFGAIAAYFALTAQRIPPQRAGLALALFFLGGATAIFGDLYSVLPSAFNFIFWFFPPSFLNTGVELGVTRLGGASVASGSAVWYMLARYGIRGIFVSGKKWRLIVFIAFFLLGFLGGFRALFISIGLTFLIQFFLEGLHRTQLLPIFALIGVLTMVVMIPLVPKLPFTFQRELSFLPLPVDPLAKQAGDETLDWRYAMWKALWPQVPQYLLVGKGYGFAQEDFAFMGDTAFRKTVDASQGTLALSGDYHNGWLSVLITFGIWGMIVTLWFFAAGTRVLYCNFRYGDSRLQTINAFLLANFLTRVVMFMTISGAGLHSDLLPLAGALGLSVALNGGVRQPAPQPVQAQRPMIHPARILPRDRPAFQR